MEGRKRVRAAPPEGCLINDRTDPLFEKSKHRLLGARPPVNSKDHLVCSPAVCSPQNEVDLIDAGILRGPPVATNVYACRYGAVHLCSMTECTLYTADVDQTCPVSGMQWSNRVVSYDKNDSRTWNAITDDGTILKKKPRSKARGTPSDETVLSVARDTIVQLLHSDTRTQINNGAIVERHRRDKSAKRTYVNQRAAAEQLPFSSDLYRINAFIHSEDLPMVIYEQDESRIAYYAGIIKQMWDIVQQHYVPQTGRKKDQADQAPRLDAKILCIGVLYSMRDGIISDGRVILPRDAFLRAALPDASLLPSFHIDKRFITQGNSYLTLSFKAAVENGHSLESISVDLVRLNRQHDARIPLRKLGSKKVT